MDNRRRIKTSLVQKLIDAQGKQDLKAYNEVLSEDYHWVKHSTGKHIPRDELSKWLVAMMLLRQKVLGSFMKMMK